MDVELGQGAGDDEGGPVGVVGRHDAALEVEGDAELVEGVEGGHALQVGVAPVVLDLANV